MRKKSEFHTLWVLTLLAIAISLGVLYFYIEQFGSVRSSDQKNWAQFGDYVGGLLGPAFAFLGLIALLVTIRLQSKELAISSRELAHSAKALADQSSSLKLQNFENRFFNMLSLHHEIVNGLDLRSDKEVNTRGRDCFREFYRELSEYLNKAIRGDLGTYDQGVLYEYENFYRRYGFELNHYFRNFYRILKYINEADVDNKREYSGVLRAQLSNAELVLLFYNGLSPHGINLKPLAEHYALFENFEIDSLCNPGQDVHFYDYEAYGDRANQIKSARNS